MRYYVSLIAPWMAKYSSRQQLLKVGFEYVTERNGIKIYRTPKAFARLQS